MSVSLWIDRFEGKTKAREIAVLTTEDGRQIDFPRDLLPKGARAGEMLAFTIERDRGATKKVADATRDVQAELKKRDPGGDIKL